MNRSRSSSIDHDSVSDAAREVLGSFGLSRGEDVALLDIPMHGNVGDSLITLGEFQLLRSMGVRIVHCGSRRDALSSTFDRIPKGSTILLHGGGNLGDLWPQNQLYRLDVTERAAPTNRVIWLPQSLHFSESEELLHRTRVVLAKCRPLVLLRDQQSVDRWAGLFDTQAHLCPDMGMIPRLPASSLDEQDTLHLFRRDKESAYAHGSRSSLDWGDVPKSPTMVRVLDRHVAQDPASWLRRRVGEQWVFERLAQSRVGRGLSLMAGAGTVHTDRLHAAIMALATGRSVLVHDNSYGKISAVLGTWRDHLDVFAFRLSDEGCSSCDLGDIHLDESP